MFRKDRIGRRGGGIILYIKESIQAYEIKLEKEAECEDAVLVLSSQKEFVDNVKICEPLGCSDHNQLYFIIKVKGERNRKIRYMKQFHKGRYKDIKENLAKINWNNTLKNNTATECWNILKSEIDGVVDQCVPLKKQGKRSKKKHLSKKALYKSSTSK